jgi:hypothetical protein
MCFYDYTDFGIPVENKEFAILIFWLTLNGFLVEDL